MALFKKTAKTKTNSLKSPIKRRRTRVRSQQIERERLVSLINSMGDGVIAVDTNLQVVVYNGAALNILDSNTSMHGKALSGLVELVGKNNISVDIVELIKDIKFATESRDYSIQYKDGTRANLYLSIAPVHLGYGQVGSEGYVFIFRDITREKTLEEERNEFISVVSHELRTPIAISEGNISNALFIAERTGDMSQIKTALTAAHDQVLFLADLINDLATLSRAERGKLVLDVEQISVTKLLHDLEQNYKAQAEKKGLELRIKTPQPLNDLSSSKLYVREVLQNFITNSIKYTDTGSVTISARNTKTGIQFNVTDTGIGISKSDQEKVFDKFFRSEDFHTRQTNGTGLGLYVTMKLARILHADINVTSKIGKGSTFTIDIPNQK